MNKYIKIAILVTVLIGSVNSFSFVQAQETETANVDATASISFPIPELSDCADKNDCRRFCNQLVNVEVCVNFAKAHGLLSSVDADKALKFKFKEGPGGCKDKESCKTFCTNTENVNICVKFAKDHKLSSDENIEKFRKLQEAIKDGETPGSCANKPECERYCALRSNSERCIKFAEDKGLVEAARLAEIRKFHEAVKDRTTPGNCDSKESCKTFCADETNKEVCVRFAEKYGLINSDEAKKIREGRVGPGGCDSKETCEAYCNNPENFQTCLNFAHRNNVISEDQIDQIKDAVKTVNDGFGNINVRDEVQRCLSGVLDQATINRIKSGEFTPDAQTALIIKQCMLKIETMRSINKPVEPTTTAPALTAIQKECIIKLYGPAVVAGVDEGRAQITPEMKEKIAICIRTNSSTIKQ